MPVDVEHERLGVFRAVRVSPATTVKEAIEKYLAEHNPQKPPAHTWTLFEVFTTPPIERRLPDSELVLNVRVGCGLMCGWLDERAAIFRFSPTFPSHSTPPSSLSSSSLQKNWPKGVEGSRFVLRDLSEVEMGTPSATMVGKLDKRGGGHKTWKTRHFILQDKGLVYYKSAPQKQKDFDSPLGVFAYTNAVVYTIRSVKKAPRPELCFCLRPHEPTGLWPSDPKQVGAYVLEPARSRTWSNRPPYYLCHCRLRKRLKTAAGSCAPSARQTAQTGLPPS